MWFKLIVHTIITMFSEFDPFKGAKNSNKHGLFLASAAKLECGQAETWSDQREVKRYAET